MIGTGVLLVREHGDGASLVQELTSQHDVSCG